MSRFVPFFVLILVGCGGTEDGPILSDNESELTTDDWPPSPPWGPTTSETPIDPRQVRMRIDDHQGLERICDVSHLGQVQENNRGRVERQMVRCVGATGAGWADLHYPPEAAELAAYVRIGERLKVRVRPEPGFEGHPALEFLASMGPTEARERRERDPGVATDWARVAQLGDYEVHRCAVSYVGPIEPASEEFEDASYTAMVSCNSRSGEHWVEMVFPQVTQTAALRVVRGEVVAARLLEAGERHPLVRYEGP
ncbi:MAG: hypothetical protein AB8H86_30265 [Polyangiales bacterium]